MQENFSIKEAQVNMSEGHADGFTGLIVSGIVWLNVAVISSMFSDEITIWLLLVGRTLINPITSFLNKILNLKGHNKNNPLKNLAFENTVWMIMCIPIAYGLGLQKAEWFFLSMLLIIGGRYLTFATVFGQKIYWLLGGSLAVASYVLFIHKASNLVCLFTGSMIELTYGFVIYHLYCRKHVL